MKQIITFLLLLIIISSCEKNSFDENHEFMYGKWKVKDIDTMWNDDDEDYFHTISFHKPNNYSFLLNSETVEKGKFYVKTQSTNKIKLELQYKERLNNYFNTLWIYNTDLEISVYRSDSIKIVNNIMDGGWFSVILIKE